MAEQSIEIGAYYIIHGYGKPVEIASPGSNRCERHRMTLAAE